MRKNKQRMLTLKEIETYAKCQMTRHLNKPWAFEWSDKMTTSFGMCYYGLIIRLSRKYTLLNNKFFPIIKDVILHEIAHAIQLERQGYLSHNSDWKKCCLEIGARPEARFSTFDVTCPCPKWALRNAISGKVYEYHKQELNMPLEDYTQFFIDEPKLPNKFEMVWCGD